MWQALMSPFRKKPLPLPQLSSSEDLEYYEDVGDTMPTENSVLDEMNGKRVRVYVNPRGISLTGKLVGHDTAAIILQDNYGKTVVYKNQAISVTEDMTNE